MQIRHGFTSKTCEITIIKEYLPIRDTHDTV